MTASYTTVENRQAVLRVSRRVLEGLLPNWQTAAEIRFGDVLNNLYLSNEERLAALGEPYCKALKLPPNCRITGISYTAGFDRDEVLFRIASPDFVATPEECVLPEVQAMYQIHHDPGVGGEQVPCQGPLPLNAVRCAGIIGHFLGWQLGPAIAVQAEHDDPQGVPGPGTLGGVENDTDVSAAAHRPWKEVKQSFPAQPSPATLNGLPVVVMRSCWMCKQPTARTLPDSRTDVLVAECEECSRRPML